ncbi:MAG: hypothetical protein AMK72_05480 [Planctomycetes bacterium SM23_25]|nr:MAG: hypothetical protein AMS14_08045 [Planctomycetes bacterium DG_20]KPK49069.1 MAG: hypothetical protein AMK72_05480 [Planctomycetes bacterium SM23_25]
MATRRWAARLVAVLLALGWLPAAWAEDAAAAGAAPPGPAAGALSLPAEKPDAPADWYAPLKDMKVGPGTLSIDGSFRARWEYTDNFHVRQFNTGLDDDVWLLRTRVGFDYRFTEDTHAYLQFQDAHHYRYTLQREQFPVTCPFFDQVDVKQAFVEAKHIGGSPFGFKIGRQAITYADRRIFGPGDWGNVGRYWWDAAKLYIDTKPVQVDLLFGQRVVSEQIHWNEQHFDFDMFGAYARFRQLPCQLDAFYLVRYDDHDTARRNAGRGHERRHTIGAYASGTFGKNWDAGGTLAAQFGQWGRNEIEAYGANAWLGYTFDHPWTPRVAAEFSYASGDRDPADNKHQTFDGVFGAVDCFYGRMNLVAWMNLMDYQATFSVKPLKNVTLSCDYHYFALASDADAWYYCNGQPERTGRVAGSGTFLGQEIDLLAKWQVTRNVELFAGYARFFGGSVVADTPAGRNDADWAFVQFTYSF